MHFLVSQFFSITSPAVIDLNVIAPDQPTLKTLDLTPEKYSSCKFIYLPLLSCEGTILYDNSTGTPRPLVPDSHWQFVFFPLHSWANPSITALVKFVSDRLLSPNMQQNITDWARSYLNCRNSKFHRYVRRSLGRFAHSEEHFHHVVIDIVGPWHVSYGFSYLLTCVDSFSHWPAAIPIMDFSAETVSKAFIVHWISRFGIPAQITTDRGCQFEASLFCKLFQSLGVHHFKITSSHPTLNGIIEWFHRWLRQPYMPLQIQLHGWNFCLLLFWPTMQLWRLILAILSPISTIASYWPWQIPFWN